MSTRITLPLVLLWITIPFAAFALFLAFLHVQPVALFRKARRERKARQADADQGNEIFPVEDLELIWLRAARNLFGNSGSERVRTTWPKAAAWAEAKSADPTKIRYASVFRPDDPQAWTDGTEFIWRAGRFSGDLRTTSRPRRPQAGQEGQQ